jgi:hypothetical protein
MVRSRVFVSHARFPCGPLSLCVILSRVETDDERRAIFSVLASIEERRAAAELRIWAISTMTMTMTKLARSSTNPADSFLNGRFDGLLLPLCSLVHHPCVRFSRRGSRGLRRGRRITHRDVKQKSSLRRCSSRSIRQRTPTSVPADSIQRTSRV